MDFISGLIYALVGMFAGITSGLFGLGGGTTIVPSMMSLHINVHHAIGISVIQMIFASIFGSILNYRKKLLRLHQGVFLGIGGLIGASFSGLILRVLSEITLSSVFLALMLFSFYQFIFKKKPQIDQTISVSPKKERFILVITGIVVGVFAVSLGVGGGLLMVPILIRYLGYDTKQISVLSLFFIIWSSISGSYSLFTHGVIDSEVIHIGLIIGVASMIGVGIGIWCIQKIPTIWHRRLLGIVYIVSISLTAWHLIQKI